MNEKFNIHAINIELAVFYFHIKKKKYLQMSLLSFYSVHMMRPNAYIVCMYIYIYKVYTHTHTHICKWLPYSMNIAILCSYFCLVISIYKFGAKFEIISTYVHI